MQAGADDTIIFFVTDRHVDRRGRPLVVAVRNPGSKRWRGAILSIGPPQKRAHFYRNYRLRGQHFALPLPADARLSLLGSGPSRGTILNSQRLGCAARHISFRGSAERRIGLRVLFRLRYY